MNFYNRLYRGFEAEYFVVSRLFAAGFEAFKLPGDFGFDLIVANIRQRTFDVESNSESARFPHVIQVKSRRLRNSYFGDGPSERPEADIRFAINTEGWNRLVQEERASLVSVLLDPTLNQSIHTAFWLPGPQLTNLERRGYFRKDTSKSKIEYDVRLRLNPQQRRDDLLEGMVKEGHLTESGRNRLQKLLPRMVPRNWQAQPYLSLLRPDRSGSPKLVARKLSAELTDLGEIGRTVNLRNLD